MGIHWDVRGGEAVGSRQKGADENGEFRESGFGCVTGKPEQPTERREGGGVKSEILLETLELLECRLAVKR